jgi:hypothetical protein
MVRIASRLFVGMLGVVMGSVQVPSAAHAQSVTVPDPRGDVMTQDEVSALFRIVPDHDELDIVRTRFSHGEHRIQVRMAFADLRRDSSRPNYYALRIVSDRSPRRRVRVGVELGRRTSVLRWVRPISCPVYHSIDYELDVVIIGLPRSCVGRPRWVRIGASVQGYSGISTYEDAAWTGLNPRFAPVVRSTLTPERLYPGRSHTPASGADEPVHRPIKRNLAAWGWFYDLIFNASVLRCPPC